MSQPEIPGRDTAWLDWRGYFTFSLFYNHLQGSYTIISGDAQYVNSG